MGQFIKIESDLVGMAKTTHLPKRSVGSIIDHRIDYLSITPRARMGSESIAHEAEGRMGY